MARHRHVPCSICGYDITVRVQGQQDMRLDKHGYAAETIAALSPLCPRCCTRLIRTGQTPEYLRQCSIEYAAFCSQAAFHDMLKAGRLDDKQRTALDDAFQEVIRQAREVMLGCDTTSESN